MTDDNSSERNTNTEMVAEASQHSDEVNLLDLLLLLSSFKALIVGATIVAMAFATAVAFLLPKMYVGRAVLMPPQQQGASSAAMLGQIGALVGITPSSIGLKNPNDLYAGLLRSRTVSDALIAKFNLQKLYELDTLFETREKLSEITTVVSGKDGLLVLEVEDRDPIRAAEMANAYIEQLDRLTQTLAVTEAAQRRLFFGKQLEKAKEELGTAELAFKTTQEKTGLVQLDQQGRAMIEAVAGLRARIVAKEVEIASMRTFATENNPDLRKNQQELVTLRSELRKLESSSGVDANLLLGTKDIPEAGLQYARSYRDLKYSETMFEVMAKQYELARVDEAQDSVTVQIVDQAIIPDRHVKPRRALIVALTGLVTGTLGVLFTLILGTWIRLDTAADKERFAQLVRSFRLRQ
jgi:tyrosine-protein kinase Etk/Wzc